MNDEYYLIEGGEKKGPYTFNELIDMELTIHTEIIIPKSDVPQYASELPEFNAYFEAQGIYFPTLDNLAPYGSRIIAFIIDYVLVSGVALLIDIKMGWFVMPTQPTLVLPYPQQLIIAGTCYSIFLIYNVLFETSFFKGSIGKMLFKIIVVDANGKNLKIINSLVKNLGVILSLMFFTVPFLSAFFNEHHQTWYERLTKSYQIVKN
ncbi:MAG: RDD family protein [Bacteroidota bacterium]